MAASLRRAGGERQVPRSETPRSSQATTPIAAANRFELLVGEQKSLVQSAQDGLQQALASLEKASSKEEQESARLQVLSLLTRAEELVTTLKIVIEIKTELNHVQKELAECKRTKKDWREVQYRLQWLEQRLERMLLARRRARPGAGGRRAQPFSGLPFGEQGSRPPPLRHPRPGAGNRARTIATMAAYSPAKSSTGSTVISDRDTLSISIRDSTIPAGTPWKTESTATHSSPPGGATTVTTTFRSRSQQSQSLASTRRSASRDSDSWHSESEANWTMVDAYSNRIKDITQSQVLSSADDEQKQSLPEAVYSRRMSVTFDDTPQPTTTKDLLSPFSEGDEEKALSKEAAVEPPLVAPAACRPDLPAFTEQQQQQQQKESAVSLDASVYGFEAPRDADVFGAISWNSLCLATNKNFFKQGGGAEESHSSKSAKLSIAMLRSVLASMSLEVDALRQQVGVAAQAATLPGPMPPLPSRGTYQKQSIAGSGRLKATTSYSRTSSTHSPHMSVKGGKSTAVVLPSLDVVSANYPPAKPSRKIYGQKARSYTYPRVSAAWGQSNYLSPTRTTSRTESSNLWVPQTQQGSRKQSAAFRQQSALRRRCVRSSRSRTPRTATARNVDVFDRRKHQENCIKHLLGQLESKRSEDRINSIQALGELQSRSSEVVKAHLERIMTCDPNPTVKYEAMKSLFKLGRLDEKVLQFAASVLKQGSCELQCDLLELLCTEKVLAQFSTFAHDGCPSAGWTGLYRALSELLVSPRPQSKVVSLLVAILLSQAGREREGCVGRLLKALDGSIGGGGNGPSAQHQSLALSCLVRCWQCFSKEVITAALTQMETQHCLQLRIAAIDALRAIGEDELALFERDGLNIFEIVMHRLVNEPVQAVRLKLGLLLEELGLGKKARETLVGRLESPNEATRAEAVIGLGGFELRDRATVQMLLDFLELDPSTYVRVQIVRVLSGLRFYCSITVGKLAEKSIGEGLIQRECCRALQIMAKNLKLCKVEE